ncbi:MAG TPA: hypothetical protein VFU15_04535, partial [Bacteroidia bacterium]|nr:hypothetical protein [Bacteroidia bacterium]
MKNLIALSESLNLAEIKLVKHLCKHKSNDDPHKKEKLFDIVLKNKPVSDAAAARELGYARADNSFHNLKQRLRADIFSVLLMQKGTSKFSTPYAQALFECRRNLLHGEVLMSRGVYEEAADLLSKALKTAGRFQLYAEQMQIEDLLRNHTALSGNIYAFRTANDSIEKNYRLLGQMMEAKKKHYELTDPRLMGASSL